MENTIVWIILPAAAGLVGGIIGTVIAPWAHWGVEKRRQRQTKRRELISASRALLTSDMDLKTFRETATYAKLRPHLLKPVRETVEKLKPTDPENSNEQNEANIKERILEDIARIEREWILI